MSDLEIFARFQRRWFESRTLQITVNVELFLGVPSRAEYERIFPHLPVGGIAERVAAEHRIHPVIVVDMTETSITFERRWASATLRAAAIRAGVRERFTLEVDP